MVSVVAVVAVVAAVVVVVAVNVVVVVGRVLLDQQAPRYRLNKVILKKIKNQERFTEYYFEAVLRIHLILIRIRLFLC